MYSKRKRLFKKRASLKKYRVDEIPGEGKYAIVRNRTFIAKSEFSEEENSKLVVINRANYFQIDRVEKRKH